MPSKARKYTYEVARVALGKVLIRVVTRPHQQLLAETVASRCDVEEFAKIFCKAVAVNGLVEVTAVLLVD
jgi:hypothetical protein